MTRRKANPLPRLECLRRAREAYRESPNKWSPFQHMDEDWKEEVGRKGGLACRARHPDHHSTIAILGGKAKKPKSHFRHQPIKGRP